MKDALAPNTLETVFLHGDVRRGPGVSIDMFYRLILHRHRLSFEENPRQRL